MATKLMKLRRADSCSACGAELGPGTRAEWDNVDRHVTCVRCVGERGVDPSDPTGPTESDVAVESDLDVVSADETDNTHDRVSKLETPVDVEEPPPLDVGVAGASGRQEHERRRAKHDRRIEEKWGTGFIGKAAKALSEEPQSTKAWQRGALGEEKLAKLLGARLNGRAVVLHDRQVPGTRGNIDHIAIGPTGIWIIDAKLYKGKVERRDKGSMFRSDFRLYVGGRDRTKLVTQMAWQRDAVDLVLERLDVPVHVALTFVDAEWPVLFRKPERFGDVIVVWPRRLAEMIIADGPLDESMIDQIARILANALPAN